MDTDALQFHQPTGPRPPSKRGLLWNELAQLHTQLGIDPPTATYTRAALEADVMLARRATEHPVADRRADIDSMPFNAPPEGGDHRSRKTWRNFYGPLFFDRRPTPEPYRSTPREDESSRYSAPAPADHSTALCYAERVVVRVHGRHVWGRQVQHATVANLVRPAP